MKKSILLSVFLLACMLVQSQTFERATKEVQEDEKIVLFVNGVRFDTFVSPSGACYLPRVSKSGTTYKFYFGYLTTFYFEGKDVYSDKEQTKYWILGLTKTGSIKKIPLKIK